MSVEIGDCYVDHRREKEFYAYRVLSLMDRGYAYVEFLHVNREPYYDVGYIGNETLPDIYVQVGPHKINFDYNKITPAEYQELRNQALGLMGLREVTNPVLRNILAIQKLVDAEALIRGAVREELKSAEGAKRDA